MQKNVAALASSRKLGKADLLQYRTYFASGKDGESCCHLYNANLDLEVLFWDLGTGFFGAVNPRFDRFPDILDGLFPRFALADAAWETGNLRHPPTVFMIGIDYRLSHL